MSNTTNLSFQLNAPFPYQSYGVNYEGQPYVGIQSIVDRLNEVVGPLNWRHEFYDVTENLEDFSVELLGRLSIWDEGKQIWMERVNYGNDTMTVNRGETYPKAQDRMDCKKSAVSDSLKKCASWFGVASDIFKGFIDVIKAKKNDGNDNPLYQRLVATHAIIDHYGTHKYGIPVLPESYREYYKEKGWAGIFQSDLTASFNGKNTTQTGKSESNEPTSIIPDDQHPGASTGSGTSSSTSSRNSGSRGSGNGSTGSGTRGGTSTRGNNSSSTTNKPTAIRMKVLDAPKFNPDGSATFKAKMESGQEVSVFAGKEMAEEVRKIRPNIVVNTTGWYREDQQKITLATKGGKIEIENAA